LRTEQWFDTPLRTIFVWGLFCLTCLHMILLEPYAILIPGERTNLFSGLGCLPILITAFILGRPAAAKPRPVEVIVSVALTALAIVSSLLSSAPQSAIVRAFTMMSSSLAGYWCSRLLLGTKEDRIFFCRFCLGLLCLALALALAGLKVSGQIDWFVGTHWHERASLITLLSFAPLALLWSRSRPLIILAVIVLGLCYVTLVISGLNRGTKSVVIIPVILLLIAACWRRWPIKHSALILGLLCLMSVIAVAHLRFRAQGFDLQHESLAYRAENVFFSWRIAVRHPIFGIGLWAPRDKYLENYNMTYPYVSKETFKEWVMTLRTSENSVLTFLVDLGFPFVIIYCFVLVAIVLRLVRMAFKPPEGFFPHPLALLLPITAAILHFQVFDGLFHPQVGWFFHVLLGMVLVPSEVTVPHVAPELKKAALLRMTVAVAAIVLGLFVGLILPGEATKQFISTFFVH
jgi:O-Antigen ligase